MGSLLLNHLGGGEGGIEHFFQQFTGPMTAWWKVLGQPVLTPEVQKKLIDSVHAEVGSRSIDELAAERDEMLLGLIELRTKVENASAASKKGCPRRLTILGSPLGQDRIAAELRARFNSGPAMRSEIVMSETLDIWRGRKSRRRPQCRVQRARSRGS